MPKNKKSWFSIRAAVDGEPAEVLIYDEIGMFGVTAKMFYDQLKALGDVDKVTVRINSPGGELFAGIAIYNMLAELDAEVTVRIDGLAASVASLIAMAGETVIMPDNAMLMIHDPVGHVMGGADDMREMADLLDRMRQTMIAAYARKSGLSDSEISEIMDAETWFTAAEAVEAGFADEIAASVRAAARFDLTRYDHPPRMSGKRSPTMTQTQQQPPANTPAPAPAPTPAPAAAPAPTPAAATAVTETAEQMRARIQQEVQDRAAEITALCKMVNKADRAAEFIASGKSVSEVLATLDAEAATAPRPQPGGQPAATTITAAHQPATNGSNVQTDEDVSDLRKQINPSKIWANANKVKALGLR
jgi:ATP-dependent Clp endopeptidase proteolytic subunit ClpP